MASRKRIYDAELREGAVRIAAETGQPIPEVAEDLGVHPGTLHSWISRAQRNESQSSDRPVAEPSGGQLREVDRAELEQLRAEAGGKDKRAQGPSSLPPVPVDFLHAALAEPGGPDHRARRAPAEADHS
ncbi:transposase [Streptomyces sp. NPDC048664]|uniref:transposase n=1 Tax=Streptomyces sp. NPDC048664 TaxID=3154505 RepID=UPI003420BE37